MDDRNLSINHCSYGREKVTAKASQFFFPPKDQVKGQTMSLGIHHQNGTRPSSPS